MILQCHTHLPPMSVICGGLQWIWVRTVLEVLNGTVLWKNRKLLGRAVGLWVFKNQSEVCSCLHTADMFSDMCLGVVCGHMEITSGNVSLSYALVCSEISPIYILQRMNPNGFGGPLTVPQTPPWGWFFFFFLLLTKYLNNYQMDCHEIWYSHLCSPEDESQWLWWACDFSPRATNN